MTYEHSSEALGGRGVSVLVAQMKRASMAAVLVLAAAVGVDGQPARSFPAIDVRVPALPVPFQAEGRTYLVYELHVTNLSTRALTLRSVDVVDGSAPNRQVLLRLKGATLSSAFHRIGSQPDERPEPSLAGGQSALIFVWLTAPSATPPRNLMHRFDLEIGGATSTVVGIPVSVSQRQVPQIRPPLRGNHWLAANGPDNASDHRRTLLALAGQGRIAQRFAIDWVRLYDDGRTVQGDPLKNESYRAYGAEVLAVADGIVSATQDGIPENVPDPLRRAVAITPETITGNYVLLRIGDAAYALYAHLRPGSLTVKRGDQVRTGQVLGSVGNTGNSTEPHLHFQIADRDAPMDAEGVPYALESFGIEETSAQATQSIVPIGNSLGLNAPGLQQWTWRSPQRRRMEMPLINTIVKFADRRHEF